MTRCSGVCQYAKDIGMERLACCDKVCYYESHERLEKKYLVEIEGKDHSFEVPIFASSLEEATLKSQEYEDGGFIVGRIRPVVI